MGTEYSNVLKNSKLQVGNTIVQCNYTSNWQVFRLFNEHDILHLILSKEIAAIAGFKIKKLKQKKGR